MKVVYRYGFTAYVGPQFIKMPQGAQLLSVHMRTTQDWNLGHSHVMAVDDLDPSLWALIDDEKPLKLRGIWVAETGMSVPEPIVSTGKLVGAMHKLLPTGKWYAAHIFDSGIEAKLDADVAKLRVRLEGSNFGGH